VSSRVTALLAGLAVLVAGCGERLTTPADCPALCPGTGADVFDTVLVAITGADSTYDGYASQADVPSILVSNGLPEREARAFLRFPGRPDTISVAGAVHPYTTDSLVFSFTLEGRDPASKDIRLYVHQITRAVDTLTTFGDIESQLTDQTLIDSLLLPDTVNAGSRIRILVAGESLDRLVFAPEDSGIVAIALRVTGDRPTGLRLGSHISVNGAPTFVTFAHVDVADSALRKQSLTLGAEVANYVIQGGEPASADDRHVVGTRRAHRTLLRFSVPPELRDSVSVLRATLELTLAEPLPGLPGDPGNLDLRGIVADFGAKSPIIAGNIGFLSLVAGTTDVLSVDVRNVVSLWFIPDGPPSALFLRVSPEGGTFALPEFLSTRAVSGAPRIRLTYARPTQPGHP
jgi:hypothetical protein